jgi:hypothetical protein
LVQKKGGHSSYAQKRRWSFFGEVGVARGGVMTMMLVGKLNDVSMVCVISHGGCMCRWKDWLHK